mmetsp:Transcript_93440/g.285941  ORF Transcript_93440/g.285941 Transcript_93440/m.285941 type:complete len:200 (-) Transcript_93440:85-684(-)
MDMTLKNPTTSPNHARSAQRSAPQAAAEQARATDGKKSTRTTLHVLAMLLCHRKASATTCGTSTDRQRTTARYSKDWRRKETITMPSEYWSNKVNAVEAKRTNRWKVGLDWAVEARATSKAAPSPSGPGAGPLKATLPDAGSDSASCSASLDTGTSAVYSGVPGCATAVERMRLPAQPISGCPSGPGAGSLKATLLAAG